MADPLVALEDHIARVAQRMRRQARRGVYRGRVDSPAAASYFESCRRYDPRTGTVLLFTHDTGLHSCGWWKNPDYENCLHLSMSFFDRETRFRRDRDPALSRAWVKAFFGDWERLIWAEPPYSEEGKTRDVWHYRVFTSPDFRTPLLPRGEVYSRELTERGWKSWSELHGEPSQGGLPRG